MIDISGIMATAKAASCGCRAEVAGNRLATGDCQLVYAVFDVIRGHSFPLMHSDGGPDHVSGNRVSK